MAQRLVRAKRKIRNAGIPTACRPRITPERTARSVSCTSCSTRATPRARATTSCVRASRKKPFASPVPSRSSCRTSPRRWRCSRHAPPRRAPRGSCRQDGDSSPRGAGPHPLGPERDRRGSRAARRRAATGAAGPYQVQAAIAACHATAPDAGSTDCPDRPLYGELVRMTPTPVVALNRAVAVAMAEAGSGPGAGRRVGSVRRAPRLPPAARHPRRSAPPARRRAEAAAAYRGRSTSPVPTPSAGTSSTGGGRGTRLSR